MTYFLDFDRTLFDTSAFLKYVIDRDGLSNLEGLSEVDQAMAFGVLADARKLSFAPKELTRFLYPDAKEFLDAHEAECVVVTFGNMALQLGKLASAFHSRRSLKYFCTGLERKGAHIARILPEYRGPYAFIDDKQVELDSVASMCPDISFYEMRRDGGNGSGRYPVLHSFSEFS